LENEPREAPDLEELPGGAVGNLPDFSPQRRDWHPILQELVRSGLALILAVLLGLTIIWGFLAAGEGGTGWENTKELLQLLLPAETGLLGSAVGFYFGTRK
jgi:hypothetical protein